MRTTRRTRRRQSPVRLAAALLGAALAHGGLLFIAAETDWSPLRSDPIAWHGGTPADDAVSPIEFRGEAEERPANDIVESLRQPDGPTPEEKKREEEKKRQEEDQNGQVVDIERPALEQRPDDSKYVAEYDSSVSHETRGKPGLDRAGAPIAVQGSEREHHGPQPSPPSGTPSARPGLPGPRRHTMPDGHQGPRGQDGVAEQQGPDGTDARPGPSGHRGSTQKPSLGEGGSPGTPGVPKPNLKASDDMLARAIAKGAGSPDWLPDVDEGTATQLNAKKVAWAPFLNRVKREVAREWNPSVVYQRHDPDGNIYGIKDRVTRVSVRLNRDGTVASLQLVDSSGVGFLDDEAMDAFRRAAPFVNPPATLADKNGVLKFDFVFIFELSGRVSTKVFHYDDKD